MIRSRRSGCESGASEIACAVRRSSCGSDIAAAERNAIASSDSFRMRSKA